MEAQSALLQGHLFWIVQNLKREERDLLAKDNHTGVDNKLKQSFAHGRKSLCRISYKRAQISHREASRVGRSIYWPKLIQPRGLFCLLLVPSGQLNPEIPGTCR